MIIEKSDEMSKHDDHVTIVVLTDIWTDRFLSLGGAEEASLVMKALELNAYKALILAVVIVQWRYF